MFLSEILFAHTPLHTYLYGKHFNIIEFSKHPICLYHTLECHVIYVLFKATELFMCDYMGDIGRFHNVSSCFSIHELSSLSRVHSRVSRLLPQDRSQSNVTSMQCVLGILEFIEQRNRKSYINVHLLTGRSNVSLFQRFMTCELFSQFKR